MKRSPVKLACRTVTIGKTKVAKIKVCRWTCPRPGATVRFRHRTDKERSAILHPSTRRPGWFQVTSFHESVGPTGHVEAPTCEKALHDGGVNRSFKLERVARSGVELQGPRRRRK